jgi:hypothetical protein
MAALVKIPTDIIPRPMRMQNTTNTAAATAAAAETLDIIPEVEVIVIYGGSSAIC